MAAADLVISRAGAMSISELALMGKAVVFIPSPYVTDNHQYKNAMALVEKGAAVCVEEKTLAEGSLIPTVKGLLEDAAARTDMGVRIRDFACPDANQRIFDRLMGLIRP
jgi:UDP-N-acetylglucosamine--N-acetylmuramyl-(pentapeptide) pyrophosphoryl-undecaprenol N-acetylglucosamine transferase